MQHARSDLEKIVAEAMRHAPAEDVPLLAWPLAAGRAVAEKTRALDFRAGVLRVGVPDAAWRAQLLALAPQYLAALNEYCGGRVERIVFVAPDEKKPPC